MFSIGFPWSPFVFECFLNLPFVCCALRVSWVFICCRLSYYSVVWISVVLSLVSHVFFGLHVLWAMEHVPNGNACWFPMFLQPSLVTMFYGHVVQVVNILCRFIITHGSYIVMCGPCMTRPGCMFDEIDVGGAWWSVRGAGGS